MQEVNIFVMRHGDKDEDGNLTELGERQIEHAVRTRLGTVPVHAIYSSEKTRAKRSAQIAARVLGLQPAQITENDLLGFKWVDCAAEAEGLPPLEPTYLETYECVGVQVTIGDLLEGCPRLRVMQTVFAQLLCDIAIFHVRIQRIKDPVINILIVSHSLPADLLLEPTSPPMNMADMLLYQYKMELTDQPEFQGAQVAHFNSLVE